MSFVNDVMAEEAGRKSLILFEDSSVFEGVDLPQVHDSVALKKKYWLNFLLVMTVLMMAIVSVNQLPPSQTESQYYSVAKQFQTVDLELPVMQGTVVQEIVAEKKTQPDKIVIKEPVAEENKLVQQSGAENKLERSQDQSLQTSPKTPARESTKEFTREYKVPTVVKSNPKVDPVLDLTTQKVIFNKKILTESTQKTPLQNSVNKQFSHAKMLLQNDDIDTAIKELQQILSLDKHHLDARLLLSSNLIDQGQINEAFKVYQNGLLLTPGEPRLAKPLAHLLVERGKIDQSLQILQQAAPSVKNDSDYYSFIASLQQQTGKHGKAITIYQKILKSQPENGRWWLGLGISLMAEARNKEALVAFESSLRDERVSSALKQFATQRIHDLIDSRSKNRGNS